MGRAFGHGQFAALSVLALFGLVAEQAEQTRGAAVAISSIAELYSLQGSSGDVITLAPGTYAINEGTVDDFGGFWPLFSNGGAWPGVFNFDGDGTTWIFDGVTIEFDTTLYEVFAGGILDAHMVAFSGTGNQFQGLTWVDLPKANGLFGRMGQDTAVFYHSGVGNEVVNFNVKTRGGSPYGFGGLYGSSADDALNFVSVERKSAYVFVGATGGLLSDTEFRHSALGDIVSFQGANADILIKNCNFLGETRTTESLPVAGANVDVDGNPFIVTFGDTDYSGAEYLSLFLPGVLNQCVLPGGGGGVNFIRAGRRFSLTGSGIGAAEGAAAGLTVENVVISGTRRGVATGASSSPTIVKGATFRGVAGRGTAACTGSGVEGFEDAALDVATGSVVLGARADAAFAPALVVDPVCADSVRGAVVDLRLAEPALGEYRRPDDDSLAVVNGRNNQVRITTDDGAALAEAGLRVRVGTCESQSNIICVLTDHPVTLESASSDNYVVAVGPVTDLGSGNTVVSIASAAAEPDVCKMVARGGRSPTGQNLKFNDRFFMSRNFYPGSFSVDGGWGGVPEDKAWFREQNTPRLIRLGTSLSQHLLTGFFYLRTPFGAAPPSTECVRWGDTVAVAFSTSSTDASNCGWYGCRVLQSYSDFWGTWPTMFHGNVAHTFTMTPRDPGTSGCVKTGDEVFIVSNNVNDRYLHATNRATVLLSSKTTALDTSVDNSGFRVYTWARELEIDFSATAAPTASPSKSPTTSAPTLAPTLAPTPFVPTPEPTTAEPTASPTLAPTPSRCSPTDAGVWGAPDGALDGADAFDKDVAVCAFTCGVEVSCLEGCFEEVRDYSTTCATCFAGFHSCMLQFCDCQEGRFGSDSAGEPCSVCAAAVCEPRFTVCTGASALSVPVFKALQTSTPAPSASGTSGAAPSAASESALESSVVIASGAGGGVALLGLLALLLVGRRRRLSSVAAKDGRFAGLRPTGALQPLTVARPFEAQFNDELSVKPGEKITGRLAQDSEHWYFCENKTTGKQGIVPAQSILHNLRPAGEMRSLVVAHPFAAEGADELSVAQADDIEGLPVAGSDGEWFYCKNLATGNEGIVPAGCIEDANSQF